jgi:hypothetical protein
MQCTYITTKKTQCKHKINSNTPNNIYCKLHKNFIKKIELNVISKNISKTSLIKSGIKKNISSLNVIYQSQYNIQSVSNSNIPKIEQYISNKCCVENCYEDIYLKSRKSKFCNSHKFQYKMYTSNCCVCCQDVYDDNEMDNYKERLNDSNRQIPRICSHWYHSKCIIKMLKTNSILPNINKPIICIICQNEIYLTENEKTQLLMEKNEINNTSYQKNFIINSKIQEEDIKIDEHCSLENELLRYQSLEIFPDSIDNSYLYEETYLQQSNSKHFEQTYESQQSLENFSSTSSQEIYHLEGEFLS